MAELRQNMVTKEWVIIADERAKRPDDYRGCNLREAAKLQTARTVAGGPHRSGQLTGTDGLLNS